MTRYHSQEFDLSAKKVFEGAEQDLLQLLLKEPVRFLGYAPTEFVTIESTRPDLLFQVQIQDVDCLVHIELQTRNEPDMLLRMLAYWISIYSRFQQPVRQILLYLGKTPMKMTTQFSYPGWLSSLPEYAFHLLDIRDIQPAELLALNNPNCLPLLPILGHQENNAETLRELTRLVLAQTQSTGIREQKELLFKTNTVHLSI